MNYTLDLTSSQESAIDLFCLTSEIIERLKLERDFHDESHKKLWFLIDASDPEGWVKKACITACHHKMCLESVKVLDLLVQAKIQMAEDRKNHVYLW